MTDNKTATERLREMLDELGVEYRTIGKKLTYWNRDGSHNDCDDADFVAEEQCGNLLIDALTPEQAISATLGSGGCEMETDWDYLYDGIPDAPEDTWAYKCSACDWSFRYDRGIRPTFCPNCGKAVKQN